MAPKSGAELDWRLTPLVHALHALQAMCGIKLLAAITAGSITKAGKSAARRILVEVA